MQYVPVDRIYVYFRYDAAHTIMCIMNTSDKEKSIQFSQFEERTKGFTNGKEVTNGVIFGDHFTIPAKKLLY